MRALRQLPAPILVALALSTTACDETSSQPLQPRSSCASLTCDETGLLSGTPPATYDPQLDSYFETVIDLDEALAADSTRVRDALVELASVYNLTSSADPTANSIVAAIEEDLAAYVSGSVTVSVRPSDCSVALGPILEGHVACAGSPANAPLPPSCEACDGDCDTRCHAPLSVPNEEVICDLVTAARSSIHMTCSPTEYELSYTVDPTIAPSEADAFESRMAALAAVLGRLDAAVLHMQWLVQSSEALANANSVVQMRLEERMEGTSNLRHRFARACATSQAADVASMLLGDADDFSDAQVAAKRLMEALQ